MRPHERLELEWSRANNLDPAGMVACSSGSSALHLALEAMRLPLGSVCLTPDYTMIACPRAVTLAGLVPRFVDCNARLLMDPGAVRDTVTGRTSAIMVVHVHGRRSGLGGSLGWPIPCPEMRVIEDLAEGHGITPATITDAACWSFFRNKVVAGEEGGAVWFRDPAHAALARQLRSCGFTEAHDYTHVPRGHNYRLADRLAEWILSTENPNGLPRFSVNLVKRLLVSAWYDGGVPAEWRLPSRQVTWIYDLRVPGLGRARMGTVVRALQAEGIAARFGFMPCSSQEEYRQPYSADESYRTHGLMDAATARPNAYLAAEEVFSLPVRPDMTSAEVEKTCDSLVKHVRAVMV